MSNSRGFTIVEIMVAVTIGIVLTGFLISMFTNNKKAYNSNNRNIQTSSDARFAFSLIREDLANVGFYGGLTRKNTIDVNYDKLVNTRCTSIFQVEDGTSKGERQINFATDTNYPIIGGEVAGYGIAGNEPDCLYHDENDLKVSDLTIGSDFLVIKGVRGSTVNDGELDSDNIYLRTGKTTGEFVASGLGSSIPVSTNSNWKYYSHIYYVTRNRLLRERLWFNSDDDESQWAREVIIGPCLPESAGCDSTDSHTESGVESLQVTYGIDSDRPEDGIADYYSDSLDITEMEHLVEVKVYLIVRNAIGSIYSSNNPIKRVYFKDNEVFGLSAPLVTEDNYKRELLTTSALLRNQWYNLKSDPSDL